MSLIKKNELKQLTEPLIAQKMFDLRKELLKLNSQRAMGTSLENPGKIKLVKKTIAKLNTRLTQIKNAPKEAPKASAEKKTTEGKKKTNE